MSNLFALSSLHLVEAEFAARAPPLPAGDGAAVRDDAEQLLEVRWVPRWSSKV
ncbi:predicted protein [Streptomyces sp. AA4]|nr:predicted protein [Streptomyces sp. AA4]